MSKTSPATDDLVVLGKIRAVHGVRGEVRLSVNEERATYWLSKGAQPSERVAQLLKAAATAEATA